jgi:hypothetical protein
MLQKLSDVDQIVAKRRRRNIEPMRTRRAPVVCKILQLWQLIRLSFKPSSTGEARAHGSTAELAKLNSLEFKTRLEIAIGTRHRYHQPRCQ